MILIPQNAVPASEALIETLVKWGLLRRDNEGEGIHANAAGSYRLVVTENGGELWMKK